MRDATPQKPGRVIGSGVNKFIFGLGRADFMEINFRIFEPGLQLFAFFRDFVAHIIKSLTFLCPRDTADPCQCLRPDFLRINIHDVILSPPGLPP